MSNKTVYLQGKARYIRPYFKDTGENLPEGSDIRNKLESTDGIYSTDVVLPFDNRDDAEEYLNELGIPTDGMMGNLLKRDKGTKEIYYKVKRPHMEPNMPVEKGSDELGFIFGPPKVVDADNNPWDEDVYIGNGSDITVKINVWKGTKVTKVRWDGVRVDNLVPYEGGDGEGF
jgi:hypothetical protein